MSDILREAIQINDKLIKHRRYLHKNAECGFNLTKTLDYIENELINLGYSPKRIGKGSIYAQIGDGDGGSLLRADIDALITDEESNVCYASKNGKMHACGHDMHTAMLLGAAELLAISKSKLKSKTTLLFQGGEEILEGAYDTLEHGILKVSNANKAISLHVIPAIQMKTGTLLLPNGGTAAPAADFFSIDLVGRACHGSTPWMGDDALGVSCKIVSHLTESLTRKISPSHGGIISIGRLVGGKAGNIIADSARLEGTVRCNSDKIQAELKEQIIKAVYGISILHNIEPKVTYLGGAPTLVIDKALAEKIKSILIKEIGKELVVSYDTKDNNANGDLGGSEDFAHFSHKIPSILIGICAGAPSEGYNYPLHHPKVTFDERSLPIGAACYTAFAQIE